MHPDANMAEQVGRSELGLECVAEPGTEGERQVSTAEEHEAGPPVPLLASQDERAQDGHADGRQGDQQQHPRPKVAGVSESSQTNGGNENEGYQAPD